MALVSPEHFEDYAITECTNAGAKLWRAEPREGIDNDRNF